MLIQIDYKLYFLGTDRLEIRIEHKTQEFKGSIKQQSEF